MKYLALLIITSLTACSICPEKPSKPEVVIKTEVVKISVPKEFTDLPDSPAKINAETATQREVATWVNMTEDYMKKLEAKLWAIRKFSDDATTGK